MGCVRLLWALTKLDSPLGDGYHLNQRVVLPRLTDEVGCVVLELLTVVLFGTRIVLLLENLNRVSYV